MFSSLTTLFAAPGESRGPKRLADFSTNARVVTLSAIALDGKVLGVISLKDLL